MALKTKPIIAMVVAATLLLVGALNYPLAKRAWLIAHPQVLDLPLPDDHVGLDTPEGQKLLGTSQHRSDFDGLQTHYSAQQYRSYCGVASGVMAANALRGKGSRTQDDWFDGRPEGTRSAWDTFFFAG